MSFGKKDSKGSGSIRRKEKMSMCDIANSYRYNLDSPSAPAFASYPPLSEVPKLDGTERAQTTIDDADKLLSIRVE